MENIFSYTTTINSHDTDINGLVRPSCVLKYMQEAANYQTMLSKPSTDELREQGRFFVTSKLSMTIHQPLYAREQIKVSTWGCESKGAVFNRGHKIERDGELCAQMASAWALLDSETGSIVRVSEVNFDFGCEPPAQPTLPLKVKIPHEIPLYLLGERTVRYPDVDINSHMNNTVYADMLFGFLQDCTEKQVSALSINYLHEAPLGQTFKVYGNSFADLSYFRTILSDGKIGVEAEFRYSPLPE